MRTWGPRGTLRDTGSPPVFVTIRFVTPGRVSRPISVRLTLCGRRHFPPRPISWGGASHQDLTCRGTGWSFPDPRSHSCLHLRVGSLHLRVEIRSSRLLSQAKQHSLSKPQFPHLCHGTFGQQIMKTIYIRMSSMGANRTRQQLRLNWTQLRCQPARIPGAVHLSGQCLRHTFVGLA